MGQAKNRSNDVAVTLGERFAWWQIFGSLGEIKTRDKQRIHSRARKALKLKEISNRVDEVREEIRVKLAEAGLTEADKAQINSIPVYRAANLDTAAVFEILPDVRDYFLGLAEAGLKASALDMLEEFLDNLESLKAGKYELPPEFQPEPTNGSPASPAAPAMAASLDVQKEAATA